MHGAPFSIVFCCFAFALVCDSVQIYEVEDAYKVNDVIEVVGVLSRVPELAVGPDDDDSAMADIDGPTLPPTSKVRSRRSARFCKQQL